MEELSGGSKSKDRATAYAVVFFLVVLICLAAIDVVLNGNVPYKSLAAFVAFCAYYATVSLITKRNLFGILVNAVIGLAVLAIALVLIVIEHHYSIISNAIILVSAMLFLRSLGWYFKWW